MKTPVDLRFLVAAGMLLALACEGNITVDVWYCPPKYPVAPGGYSHHYYGVVELRILASENPESIDSTRVAVVQIFTIDEEYNPFEAGVEAPTLAVYIDLREPGFCSHLSMPGDEGHILRLDGTDNHFFCAEWAFEYPCDAQLVLRNVGFSTAPVPEMHDAILIGYYTAKNGAERYSVRLHSFSSEEWVYC